MVHVLKGRVTVTVTVDGERTEVTHPDLTFATAMGVLRWAVDRGYVGGLDWDGGPLPLAKVALYRWSVPSHSVPWETGQAVKAALRRYLGLVHYFREVEPEWAEVPGSRVHYADNSTECTERDKYGRTRRGVVCPPSGDVCF